MVYFSVMAAVAILAQGAPQTTLARQQAALAAQRESVRRQAAAAGAWLVPWSSVTPMAEPACDPAPEAVVAPLIESAAKAQQLDPKLLRAVIEQESAFRPCAVSSKGARGLMQLMPATIEEFQVHDAFDPKESIDAGSKYLKQLLERYKGDLPLSLGAYNAGPSTVDQAGRVPDIPETQEYVDAILRKLGITRPDQPNAPKPKPTGN